MTLSAAFDVNGKVVLITGAGRGIGRGIAEVLAEAGASIALNALTARYVEAAACEIARATNKKVVPIIADVTNAEDVVRAVELVLSEFGRIDVLINALGDAVAAPLVGLPGTATAGKPISDDELHRILDLNLTAALLCTRAVGSHMLSRRVGKIINIASYSARRGGGNLVVYTLAKTALEGFTRAQALEWAPYNIQVNAIAPGIFPDPVTFGEEGATKLRQRAASLAPLGRAGRLKEAGYLALYLSSSASDYMTGQVLYLDGGMSL